MNPKQRKNRILPAIPLPWILLFALLLAAPSQGAERGETDAAGQAPPASLIVVPNPGADLWRAVRGRPEGAPTFVPEKGLGEIVRPPSAPVHSTQVRGVDAGVLINPVGEAWRQFRMERLVPYAAAAIGGVLAILLLFRVFRGRVPVEGGLSGKMLFRFGVYERALHWFLAIVFLFLAATGLVLLFGRVALKPLLGPEWLGVVGSAAKAGHNLFGPLFLVAVLLMLARFLRENIYAKGDLTWLLRGGGMIGKKHVTGGFFNMGEKTWYWFVILAGLAVSVSGLVLLFPNFGQERQWMTLSHLVHALGAVLLFAVALGHIYLGSIGTEGTLEGMKSGYVDLNWAASHHDRWAEKCVKEGAVRTPEEFERRVRGGKPAALGQGD